MKRKNIKLNCVCILLWVAGAFSVVGLNSCAQEDRLPPNIPSVGEKVAVSYTIPDKVPSGLEGRAGYVLAEGAESTVNSLWFLFFEYDAHGNGTYITALKGTMASSSLRINRITLTLSGGIDNTTDYQVLAIANLESFTTNPATFLQNACTGKTYGKVHRNLALQLVNTDGIYSFAGGILPMSGSTVKRAGKDMDINLYRAVTRVDVKVVTEKAAEITLYEAYLANVMPQVPLYETWDAGAAYIRSQSALAQASLIKGKLYTGECLRYFTGDKEDLRRRALCLILKVKSTAIHTDADTEKLLWYRTNLNLADNAQYLQRNNAYTVYITDVLTTGQESEDDAYNGASQLAIGTVTVAEWVDSGIAPPNVDID